MCQKVITADCPKSNFSRILRVFGELADGLKTLIPSAKFQEVADAEHKRIFETGFAQSNAYKLEIWGDYIATLHGLADNSPQKTPYTSNLLARLKRSKVENFNAKFAKESDRNIRHAGPCGCLRRCYAFLPSENFVFFGAFHGASRL